MGESKRPLYAYVDETGNTGHNIFDEAQPDFFTAALITKGDFDVAYEQTAKSILADLGVDALHGKDLGVARIEAISARTLQLLESAKAYFFVSRVEKKYLLASKLFDSLFDSGENAGVAWHHYNVRPLRIMFAFKLSLLIDEGTARQFWDCILEPKKEVALAALPKVCETLLANLDRVPDAKSREMLSQGLTWAKDHPEAIQIHTDRKIARQGHFPNMVAFANLLDGLEQHSKRFKKPVARITHDQQSEFQKTLKVWHEMFSNAAPDEVHWAGETYTLQKVVGSQFDVKADSESYGIQVTDIVLWLYAQFRKKKALPDGCRAILNYVFVNGWENDFSFEGVERMLLERFGGIFDKPLTEEQEVKVRELLEKAEAARLRSMAQYQADPIPPFMRSGQVIGNKDTQG